MSDDESMEPTFDPDDYSPITEQINPDDFSFITDPPIPRDNLTPPDQYDVSSLILVTDAEDTDRTLSYLTVRQAAEKYGRQERQARRWIMSLHPEQRMERPLRGLESALDELVENRQDTRTGQQQDTVLHEVITRDDPEWLKAQINSLNVQALSLTQALQTATRELESAHAERRSALESLTAIQGELESARDQLRLLQERPSEAPESPNTGITAQPDKSIGRLFRRLFGVAK